MRVFRKSRGISVFSICVAITIGVLSGFYIWKPSIVAEVERQRREKENQNTSKKPEES